MVGSIAVGLPFAPNNPNLTFIFFIALTLLVVLGLRFSFYAYRNRRESELVAEHRLWDYLALVGLLAVGFAVLGLVEILTTYVLPFKSALLLAHVFLLAVTMRMLYRSVVPAAADGGTSRERTLTRAAVLGVAVVFVGFALVGRRPALLAVLSGSALAFAGSGFSFGRRGAAETRVQGTVVDTLLRHLLPVLLFASLVPAVEIAVLAGLDRVIVLHIQVVFVIMTATTLMTATIKLRQNLASL
ncbi:MULTISPECIES: hypothetical protein [Haloarcula]|uniref:Uncharacterized protein n=1 Tax=Haloarcula pellucida TaxID=1427151 RepID=A0A830GHK3_9EURY|nr:MULTISPECIES: hypothetical protein [Halomicroarcula]MBX0347129.1 hypothetical protein [Halomicroarcula pellucida]MDS0276996.1 hypothetical protein [Halomicroarcula sp. S1AR25-4]GGN87122.1 hypothetical protein GCM10009030_05500 [Halomicroarcula pellucida]